jgi:hypothetical protein
LTKRPNFFIVGAPKCGTTALSEYLREHPRAFVTQPKEPHFFSRDFPYYYAPGQATLEHYLQLYEAAPADAIALGEASVWYLYSREAIRRIHEFAQDARIIAMVRNPVELVPSLHSQMRYMQDEDQPDPERAWELQAEREQGRSLPRTCRVPEFLQYGKAAKLGEQVRRLLDLVPRDRVKIVVFDDFRADTRAVYAEVLDFLGLPDDGRREFPTVNPNKQHRAEAIARLTQRPPRTLVRVANAVKRVTGIQRFGVLDRLRRSNRRTATRREISPAFEARLKDYFREDVELLGTLIERDLGHWVA